MRSCGRRLLTETSRRALLWLRGLLFDFNHGKGEECNGGYERHFGCDGEGQKNAVESLMGFLARCADKAGKQRGVGYDDVSEL